MRATTERNENVFVLRKQIACAFCQHDEQARADNRIAVEQRLKIIKVDVPHHAIVQGDGSGEIGRPSRTVTSLNMMTGSISATIDCCP